MKYDKRVRREIEATLAYHLPMQQTARGNVPCECGNVGRDSFNGHLTKVLTAAIVSLSGNAVPDVTGNIVPVVAGSGGKRKQVADDEATPEHICLDRLD